jgi:hypothetical protein
MLSQTPDRQRKTHVKPIGGFAISRSDSEFSRCNSLARLLIRLPGAYSSALKIASGDFDVGWESNRAGV